jgi:Asp-tRNA(Asn)/Glu-tRNA(Gln) amidotransferase A subunit family amidase
VWNWQRDGDLLPCWEYISLKGRRAYVVFDSDVMGKEGVQLALERLVRALEDRGAEILVIYLPEEAICYA